MKKFLKKSLLIGFFLAGFAMMSMAFICVPISVDCGDGTGGSAYACGESTAEIIQNAMLMADDICD
ncbi:hypothetical protein [uncultured Draconibacterium sp.]|uniref:hypothetical protein n=1 Tax=uncultured Draconibacterium sp. TaxID=1573823 RepID=UPI002611410E|nr:hypothetical protein [uncultured Draconibacterium sp.]